MTLDPAEMKRRRNVMIAVNSVAALGAIAFMALYLLKGLNWGLPLFVAALAVGFGTQVWFIAGLRRGKGDA